MGNKDELPYSYHTFMYPFSFNCLGKNNESCNYKTIRKMLPDEWKEEAFCSQNQSLEQYDNQFEEQYDFFQYFFPNARANALNVEGSQNISGQFIYIPQKSTAYDENKFRIVLRDNAENHKTEEERTITLNINGLRLSLFYKLKIGVLTIESEYYNEQKPWNNGKEVDINVDIACLINDYGRRLFSPVYDVNNEFMPDKIKIKIAGREEIVTNFSNYADLIDICSDNQEPKLINELLNKEQKNFKLRSILDDRMFVSFLIRDDSVGDIFKDTTDNKKVIGDDETIYRLTFCDGGGVTCQDSAMREEKLRNHVYTRWKNWGTIHTVSEYSLGCITGSDPHINKSVIIPFLTLYTGMARLALVQRAAISNIESEAVRISTSEKKSDDELVDEIRDLWKRYIIFQNELYMPEITFQEQGVELYGMLKQFLKIEELNSYLDDELNNLHDLAELIYSERRTKVDDNLAHAINLLTVAGTVFALFSITQDFLFGAITISEWKENSNFMRKVPFLRELPIEARVTGTVIIGFLLMGIIIRIGMRTFDNYMNDTAEKRKKPKYWVFYILVLLLMCSMFLVWSIFDVKK